MASSNQVIQHGNMNASNIQETIVQSIIKRTPYNILQPKKVEDALKQDLSKKAYWRAQDSAKHRISHLKALVCCNNCKGALVGWYTTA